MHHASVVTDPLPGLSGPASGTQMNAVHPGYYHRHTYADSALRRPGTPIAGIARMRLSYICNIDRETMHMSEERLREDVQQIRDIPFLPVLLELVCLATGMGFAAVARVTESRWIAGAVKDDIGFGLKPGGELPVASTICHEIRERKEAVIIDHVSYDKRYKDHHTPARYGFESYISVPIFRKDGGFFGTLCAIDPAAANLSAPPVLELFTTLSEMIARYLDGMVSLDQGARSRLEMYAQMEMSSTLRDLSGDSADDDLPSAHNMDRLSLKVRQLLLMIDNM